MSTYMMPVCAYIPDLIVLHLERGALRILFGQDIHVPYHVDFGLDIMQWVNQWRTCQRYNAR